MKTPIITVTTILLASCAATGTQMQAECESRFTYFPDVYSCTHQEIAKRNPSILNDARAKYYLLIGEQLAEQVTQGKISNLDAKVRWQEVFLEMKTAKESELDAILNPTKADTETTNAPSQPDKRCVKWMWIGGQRKPIWMRGRDCDKVY